MSRGSVGVEPSESKRGFNEWTRRTFKTVRNFGEKIINSPEELERKQNRGKIEHLLAECGQFFPEGEVPRDLSGNLIGLAAEARPAVIFGKDPLDLHGVAASFSESGIPLVVAGTALINEKLVKERLQAEPELALSVGWDENISVVENIESLQYDASAPPKDLAKIGFILGYPQSAIEYFGNLVELTQSQKPAIPNFFQLEPKPDWDPEDQKIAAYIQNEYAAIEGKLPPDMSARNKSFLSDAYRNTIKVSVLTQVQAIYKKYYNLGDEEIRILTDGEAVQCFSPSGKNISAFVVLGEEGRKAPDVEAVLKNIETKCHASGY